MPRDLFNAGTTPATMTRGFSRYVVIGSALLLHVGIVAVVLIVPLFADDVLPKPETSRIQYLDATFVAPNPPVAPPAVVRPVPVQVVNRDAAPIVPPERIREEQPDPRASYAIGALPNDAVAGPSGLVGLGETVTNAAPAPPPMPAPPAPQKPFRPGSGIREPLKVKNVFPVYPQIAQAARVEGKVVIEATIGTDGTVQQARVVSGTPLLNDAALDAVRQWRYRPTLLNNQPVAVIMTVTVMFTLQH
jgi:protein TonB